ncbi:MAG: ornithine cyclodeaminase family protein [Acidobacteriota bacterium]
MKLLVLSEADVHALLTLAQCIEVMEEALQDLARGDACQPLRSLLRPPGARGFMGLMPAYRGGTRPAFALKEVCVFPGNPAIGLDTHLGAVLLHSAHTGELLAVMNASAITAIRTAAVTAVATKLLARGDASTLAIIGTGVQARAHLSAVSLVRDFAEIRVAGRKAEHSRRFVEQLSASFPRLRASESVEDAVRGADVIVTVTSAGVPVLNRDWIADGAHLNLVGSSVRTAREADGATMASGPIFVDRRESTVNESGDYLFAVEEGLIGPENIRAEIGDVLIGRSEGRRTAEEITIFKSLGLAFEDLAAAEFLFRKSKAAGAGTWVEF